MTQVQKEKFYKDINFDAEYWQKAAQHVLLWNAKSRAMSLAEYAEKLEDPEFRFLEIKSQTEYLLEELKEYRDAYKIDDHVEMLDAAGDIFVVASMLTYQYFQSDLAVHAVLTSLPTDYLYDDPYEVYLRMTERKDISLEMLATSAATVMRQSRDSLLRTNYNGKKVMKAVLKSNDTKYPTTKQLKAFHESSSEMESVDLEEKWIMENRGKENVKGVWNSEYKVWVFRDNNGEGKICKPSVFSDPKQDISNIVFGGK